MHTIVNIGEIRCSRSVYCVTNTNPRIKCLLVQHFNNDRSDRILESLTRRVLNLSVISYFKIARAPRIIFTLLGICLPRSCQRGTGEFKFCGPGCLASVGFKPSVFKANCPFTKQTLVLLLWKIYVLILKVSKYG